METKRSAIWTHSDVPAAAAQNTSAKMFPVKEEDVKLFSVKV